LSRASTVYNFVPPPLPEVHPQDIFERTRLAVRAVQDKTDEKKALQKELTKLREQKLQMQSRTVKCQRDIERFKRERLEWTKRSAAVRKLRPPLERAVASYTSEIHNLSLAIKETQEGLVYYSELAGQESEVMSELKQQIVDIRREIASEIKEKDAIQLAARRLTKQLNHVDTKHLNAAKAESELKSTIHETLTFDAATARNMSLRV